ncbi:MAG: ABC transporter permease subunit [Candidatus Marsarchaeota archaeon]|nr:ABC transporter permease subunit [Candidatus Marsarchaeota archaeon]
MLLVNTSFSWLRLFIALALSIILSLFIGIAAARSKTAEKIILPVLDIFQTLPILAFFPVVIVIILSLVKGALGINLAVIFLIITSMIWNISFAVYEAVKTLPNEFLELSKIYNLSKIQKINKIYIPAAMPRVMEQSVLSFSIGLFYLVTSEIFSTGNSSYSVKYGIGVELINFGYSGNILYYLAGIAVLIIFVVLTRFIVFVPLENYFNKFKENKETATPKIVKIYQFLKKPIFKPKLSMNKMHAKKHAAVLFHANRPSYRPAYRRQPSQTNKKISFLISPKLIKFVTITVFVLLIASAMAFIYNTHYKSLIQIGNYEYISLASLLYSFIRIWAAFAVILIVSVPLTIYLIFISKNSSKFVTVFQIIASIPATILLPIIVIYLKNNGEVVAFIIFLISGIWYVIFSILAASKTFNKEISEVQSVFGIKGFNAFKKIYLKAIIPGVITGAVTGIAAEWNASIVAEYFTKSGINGPQVVTQVNRGIGKLLDTALSSGPHGNMLLMAIALINLTVMIILINTFLWKKLYKKVADIYS